MQMIMIRALIWNYLELYKQEVELRPESHLSISAHQRLLSGALMGSGVPNHALLFGTYRKSQRFFFFKTTSSSSTTF